MGKRRIMALWFPWFAAERVTRRHPALKGRPFVLCEEMNGRRIIAARNPVAEKAGFKEGMAVADARAILPDLPVFEVQCQADAKALRHLALWAGRYTPFAAPTRDATLFLDISGCAHFYGGEMGLARDAATRLKNFGFAAFAGIADTPGAAWALAHHGPGDAAIAILPSAPHETSLKALLADLPLKALRLDTDVALALGNFGLRHVSDLYNIARSDLAVRFGAELMLRFDQLLGRVEEPISPLVPPPEFQVQENFPEPLTNLATMAQVLERLLVRLCQTLTREGRGATHLSFCGFRADGKVVEVSAGSSRPTRDAAVWVRLFHEKLAFLGRDMGYDLLQLCAITTASLGAAQFDWRGERPDLAALSPLIDRLGNRFGFQYLHRLEIMQSWWPERAARRRAVFDAVSPRTWPQGRPRPLRLFSPPIAITATAPVPDDPPLFFRWQGNVHRIRAADGPERLTPEWWREDGTARDYYRVEDEAGHRFWLYREGLYTPSQPPRWFLHGLFP